MNTDFIFRQVLHMTPASFSVLEQQRYRAEKMLMRQFILRKRHSQDSVYLSVKDMKSWLLAGRSFLEEFQEIAAHTDPRKLLLAELTWTSARQRCLTQMEQEVWEELKKENRLSWLLRRKVTLEGLQLFLSVFQPQAEQCVKSSISQLCNRLLSPFIGSHTTRQAKVTLLTNLEQTIERLVPEVTATAMKFLLDVPPDKVKPRCLASALRNRAVAAGARIGKLLADAAAKCFCQATSAKRARLLHVCTSVARNMVKAIYKRFVNRSKSFHLMDFDESSIIARKATVFAIHDMDERARSAASSLALDQLFTEEEPATSEVCRVVNAEPTDRKNNKEERRGVKAFFSGLWRNIKCNF